MNVLAFDQYKNRELESDTMKYVELDKLLGGSDVISIHCPLYENTKGIINKNNINKMKDGVMIINTSRGPLVVEEDMVNVLESGKVAGFATEVLSIEPPKKDSPLLKAKNIIITPHMAWATKESRTRLMNIALENFNKYIAGTPVNVVNV